MLASKMVAVPEMLAVVMFPVVMFPVVMSAVAIVAVPVTPNVVTLRVGKVIVPGVPPILNTVLSSQTVPPSNPLGDAGGSVKTVFVARPSPGF